jgi:predicted Fe-Mo cluster-binding NifX family protein
LLSIANYFKVGVDVFMASGLLRSGYLHADAALPPANLKYCSGADMILGVPLFGSRISPHFGSSSTLAVYEVHDQRICKKHIWRIGKSCFEHPMGLARQLADSDINILICGGIQKQCKEWLIKHGISVWENYRGEAEQVITSLLASETLFQKLQPAYKGGR